MLKLRQDFDFDTQIGMMLADQMAFCPETKAYMRGSYGRRRAWAPTQIFRPAGRGRDPPNRAQRRGSLGKGE